MTLTGLVLTLIAGFSPAHAAGEKPQVTAAVAANVQFAMEELGPLFEKETGAQLKLVFGASGNFAAQIGNGAPFDVFVSADTQFPEQIEMAGLAAEKPAVYAYGTLVLWTLKNLQLSAGTFVLSDGSVQTIAVADPKTAPYGREAVRFLHHEGLYDDLKAKLVFAQDIGQTNQFIVSKAADIGFTAKSVVLAPKNKGVGKWLALPKGSYDPIAQAAVLLKHGADHDPGLAKKFFDFLYSKQARTVLEKYGYGLP